MLCVITEQNLAYSLNLSTLFGLLWIFTVYYTQNIYHFAINAPLSWKEVHQAKKIWRITRRNFVKSFCSSNLLKKLKFWNVANYQLWVLWMYFCCAFVHYISREYFRLPNPNFSNSTFDLGKIFNTRRLFCFFTFCEKIEKRTQELYK